MSSFGYQPAHPSSLAKDNTQKYEFDSPNTIARQQFQPAGGFQQGLNPLPPAYPTSTSSSRPLQRKRLNLRTRDWSGQPWGGSRQLQGDSYAPPASLLSSSWLSSRPGLLSSYPSSGFSQLGSQPSGLSQLGTHSSGLPTTNYQPSSTIPLQHNYHLPSSSLAHSSGPMESTLSSGLQNLSLNKDYNSGLQNNNYGSTSLSKDYNSGLQNYGNQSSFSNIPSAPPMPTWNRNNSFRTRGRTMRPLRTRNWGDRADQGWTGFNRQSVVEEPFLRNRLKPAPVAPALPSFLRQRSWTRGPYRQRNLRTRNWGLRNENGWANFNRGIYTHESALPFNSNRARAVNWADQSSTSQTFAPVSAPIAPIAAPIAPVAAPIMAAPLAAPIAPIAAPLKGRKARRAAKKQAKANAIQNALTTQLNPPIGDPAVNHYRRGVKATVPLAGPAIGGVAPQTGSVRSRHAGRRNNLGRRRGRLAGASLPVPATQPPFVAPVAAPLAQPFPQASYRTVYSNPSATSSFIAQPTSTFSAVPLVSSAGIPLSTSGIQQPLYTSATMQSRPLASTLTNSQGTVSNAPLYSAKEPVVGSLLNKPAQAPLVARPIGSATF